MHTFLQFFFNMKNRNLFIELNLPAEDPPKKTLLNNWSKPPPMQFHILNSPTLTHSIAELIPQTNNRQSIFNPSELPEKTYLRSRNKQRHKYKRLEEQLKFLEDYLSDLKNLRQSQLLMYRQTLMVNYLNSFLQEIKIECQEKGHFIKAIWNALIKIFQELFERLVNQNKKKERQMLSEQIKMHNDYQNRLAELSKNNEDLLVSSDKYKDSIRQLMNSIGSLNIQLKGTKILQQKSAVALKQLSQKYEQLRADYLDTVMLTGMTRSQAQALLHDKELLLFSKQIANGQTQVKVKPRQRRKARCITSQLDVGLMLQQIQADEQFQFQIECSQKKIITFNNQKVQTNALSYHKVDIDVQCGFRQRYEEDQLCHKIVQTMLCWAPNNQTNTVNTFTETEQQIVQNIKNLTLVQQVNLQIRPDLEDLRKTTKQNMHLSQSLIKHFSETFNEPVIQTPLQLSKKSLHTNEELKVLIEMQKKKNGNKSKDSKMFRVGEISRVSSRASRNYMQRVKTEGNQITSQLSNSVVQKKGSKRNSGFLLLDQLKKSMMQCKKSKFNNFAQVNYTQQLKEDTPYHIQETIFDTLVQTEAAIGGEGGQFRNLNVSKLNAEMYQKTQAFEGNMKKGIASTKCIRTVADILKLFGTCIKEGSKSFNIVPFTMSYLAAVKGQSLQLQQKQKLFCEFIKSCTPLLNSSYLIRNFFTLCGFPIKKYNNRNSSKINLKTTKEEIYDDNLSKYMYYSEISTYFKLLLLANYDQGKDLLQAYTNSQKLNQTLNHLKQLYGMAQELIEMASIAIKEALDMSGQKDPKLDIFKVLQLILQKILQSKANKVQKIQPLIGLYGQSDNKIFHQILALMSSNPYKILRALRVHRVVYKDTFSAEELASLAIIEGLDLEILPFQEIEKQYKFAILKRLLSHTKINNKLINAMVKAIPKRELKRPQFMVLLKQLWIHQCHRTERTIIGDDLFHLNIIAISHTMPKQSQNNFHSLFGQN